MVQDVRAAPDGRSVICAVRDSNYLHVVNARDPTASGALVHNYPHRPYTTTPLTTTHALLSR